MSCYRCRASRPSRCVAMFGSATALMSCSRGQHLSSASKWTKKWAAAGRTRGTAPDLVSEVPHRERSSPSKLVAESIKYPPRKYADNNTEVDDVPANGQAPPAGNRQTALVEAGLEHGLQGHAVGQIGRAHV